MIPATRIALLVLMMLPLGSPACDEPEATAGVVAYSEKVWFLFQLIVINRSEDSHPPFTGAYSLRRFSGMSKDGLQTLYLYIQQAQKAEKAFELKQWRATCADKIRFAASREALLTKMESDETEMREFRTAVVDSLPVVLGLWDAWMFRAWDRRSVR
jgi:hypothetical protein